MKQTPLVIINQRSETLGESWAPILCDKLGSPYEIHFYKEAPSFERFLPPPLDEISHIIVLGGPMGANDADRFGGMAGMASFLKEAIDAGIPTIGICLGAQLMARTLGGEVQPSGGFQTKLVKINMTDEGRDDPVFGEIKVPLVPAWHGEYFTLPDGATLLATCDLIKRDSTVISIPFAFRLGANCYAFQFEPHLTPNDLGRWLDDPELAGDLPAAAKLQYQREFTTYDETYTNQMKRLLMKWLTA